jgi:hypothetical protein
VAGNLEAGGTGKGESLILATRDRRLFAHAPQQLRDAEAIVKAASTDDRYDGVMR